MLRTEPLRELGGGRISGEHAIGWPELVTLGPGVNDPQPVLNGTRGHKQLGAAQQAPEKLTIAVPGKCLCYRPHT